MTDETATEKTEPTPEQVLVDTATDRLANIDKRVLIIDRNMEEVLAAIKAQNVDILLVCVCLACLTAAVFMLTRELRSADESS